jgi:hypothetical protein
MDSCPAMLRSARLNLRVSDNESGGLHMRVSIYTFVPRRFDSLDAKVWRCATVKLCYLSTIASACVVEQAERASTV